MKYKFTFLLFLFVIVLIVSCSKEEEKINNFYTLDNWELKQIDSTEWKKALVPGNIYKSLVYDTIIDNPLFVKYYESAIWVSDKKWEYRTVFSLNKTFLKNEKIFLVFEGLDTYSDVYLNDNLILQSENMFCEYKIDCKKFLKSGENNITIKFDFKTDNFSNLTDSTLLPFRKTAIQYGVNKAPKLINGGIWKPVYLFGYDKFTIDDFKIIQNEINDSLAKITINYKIDAVNDLKTKLVTYISDSLIIENNFNLVKGENNISQDIEISNPKLWYPIGYGEQTLYKLNSVFYFENKIIENKTSVFGLKTIEIKYDNDNKISKILINNKDFFINAAIFNSPIEVENKLNSVSKEKLIKYAAKSNINTLIISGDGIYEDDIFLSQCDEAGILVAQEIPICNHKIDFNQDFKTQFTEELQQNISKISYHTSFNFISFRYVHKNEDLKEINNFFEETISNIDSSIYYINFQDIKNIACVESDLCFPSFKTLLKLMNVADIKFESAYLNFINYESKNNLSIKESFIQSYEIPNNYEKVVLLNHIISYENINKKFENIFTSENDYIGLIFKDLNEYSPSISKSGIDFIGDWKSTQYAVKNNLKKQKIFVKQFENYLSLYLSNTENDTKNVEVLIKVADIEGKSIYKQRDKIQLEGNSTNKYLDYSISKITRNLDKNTLFLKIKIVKESETIAEKIHYFVEGKDITLEKPTITTDILNIDNGYAIEFKTDKLARFVYMTSIVDGFFEENFFDLIPGESKFIKFETTYEVVDFDNNFNITTLFDILSDQISQKKTEKF